MAPAVGTRLGHQVSEAVGTGEVAHLAAGDVLVSGKFSTDRALDQGQVQGGIGGCGCVC